MKTSKQIVDPAFLRETNYSYVDYDDPELATVLCFALSRHNKDLILHQQRIELYSKTHENDLLFSAIVDLFISLEDKGLEYRQRIFEKYKSRLTLVQISVLNNFLTRKMHASHPIQNLTQSILSQGIQGDLLSSIHLDNYDNQ